MKTDIDLQCEMMEGITSMLGRELGTISVLVMDGMVTLTGNVSGLVEKWLAEYIAREVYGVRAVANQIEIWQSATR